MNVFSGKLKGYGDYLCSNSDSVTVCVIDRVGKGAEKMLRNC